MFVTENMKDDETNRSEISTSRRSLSSEFQLTAEELAPDGGWGWIVFAGMTLCYIVCFGSVSSFGMIYGEFLTETGSDGSALSTLNIMFSSSFSFTGLFCNEFLKRYSIKTIGLLGALIYGISSILMAFMPSVSYMAIAQFLQGFGAGTIVCISNTSLNAYFVKRRAMVFTLSQVIVSTATIFFPLLSEHLLSTYGFRGCLVVLAGISFNTVCGMLTIQPVEMHYKKRKLVLHGISENQNEKLNEMILFHNSQDVDSKMDLFVDAGDDWKKRRSGVASLKLQTENEEPLLIEPSTTCELSQNSLVPGLDLETGCHHLIPPQEAHQDVFLNRISLIAATSMASITRVGGFCDLGQQIVELEEKKEAKSNRRIMSILADFFEISLLRDTAYLNMCLGMTFVFLADMIFNNFLPLILANDGYTTVEIALLLTVAAIAEVVSRIALAIFAMFFKAKARHVCFVSSCALFLSRIAFLYCHTQSSLIVVITIINLVRSWCLVTQSLVIAEHFPIDRFAAAFGLFIGIIGVFGLVVVPAIGFIKDWTGSYVVMQYILLGAMTLCIVPWAVEIWICDIFPRCEKIVNVETERPKK